ncbi:nurim-like [Schistocerca gregaria]|uniref:nurim-like n=1 Tax=Schistocerca gregaria TaxID=7010 RepID=UPI00211EC495|nr:nurim-like [Schistocerca gregaria]
MLWNILLILIFIALQSIRTKISHVFCELYIFITAISLEALTFLWIEHPNLVVWKFTHLIPYKLCLTALTLGIGFIIFMFFSMNPLELTGINHIYSSYKKISLNTSRSKKTQRLYDHYRHPSVIGLILVMWSSPTMTVDKIILALMLPLYYLNINSVDEQDSQYVSSRLQKTYFRIQDYNPLKE